MGTRGDTRKKYSKDIILNIILTELIDDIEACIKEHLKNKQPVRQTIENGMHLLASPRDCGGSGDCLFRSIECFTGANHSILRELTVAVMRSNQDKFKDVINKDSSETVQTKNGEQNVKSVEEYANLMAQAGTWGGYIEIYILASVLNRPIALLSNQYRPQIFYPHNNQDVTDDPIFLYYNGATHYQALPVREGDDAYAIFQELENLANNDNPKMLEGAESQAPPKKKRKIENSKGKQEVGESDSHVKQVTIFLNRSSRTAQPENRQDRRLDSLARLLEGTSMCVAVCLVGNEVFITSNELKDYKGTGKPFDNNDAKFMMRILSYFLALNNGQTTELPLDFLFKICFEKIDNYNQSIAMQKGNYADIVRNVARIQLDANTLRQIISDLFNAKDEIQYRANKEASDYFTPIEQAIWSRRATPNPEDKKVLLALTDRKLQIEMVQKILWRFIRDFKKSMSFFQEGNIEGCNLLAIGKENEHAEVRLIGYLLESGRLTSTELNEQVIYIGLSKLCCAYCAAKIHVINNILGTRMGLVFEENEEEKQISGEQIKKYAEEQAHSQSTEQTEKQEQSAEPSENVRKNVSSSSSSVVNPNSIGTKGYHGLYCGSSDWEAVPNYLKNKSYTSKHSYQKPVGSDPNNPEIGDHIPIRTEAVHDFRENNELLYRDLRTAYREMSVHFKRAIKESENDPEKAQYVQMVASPSSSGGDSPPKFMRSTGVPTGDGTLHQDIVELDEEDWELEEEEQEKQKSDKRKLGNQ